MTLEYFNKKLALFHKHTDIDRVEFKNYKQTMIGVGVGKRTATQIIETKWM